MRPKKKIQESRLSLFGHVERKEDDNVGKKVEKMEIKGKRRREHPKMMGGMIKW